MGWANPTFTGQDGVIRRAFQSLKAYLDGTEDRIVDLEGTVTGAGLLTPTQATDLTDGGDSALHYHASDRARANHTGTQTVATLSDHDLAAHTALGLGTAADLTAHLGDTVDAHDASAISTVAAGSLSSTDVQAALNELDTEKLALAGGTMTGAIDAPKATYQTDLGINRDYAIVAAYNAFTPTGALGLLVNEVTPTGAGPHRLRFRCWESSTQRLTLLEIQFYFDPATGIVTNASWISLGSSTPTQVRVGYVTASPYQLAIFIDETTRLWSAPNVTWEAEVGGVFGTDPGSTYMDACTASAYSSLASYTTVVATQTRIPGSAIANTASGSIAATTVQAAIDELASEKLNLASGAAAQIITGTSNITTADGTGVVQFGASGGINVAIDQNEIQARDGTGAANTLYLNYKGGFIAPGDGTTTGTKISLFGGATPTYGIGIESGTKTDWANTRHRWRLGGTSASTGTAEMELDATSLNLQANTLTNIADPTTDDHVGDRGYNDTRYVNTTGDTMAGVLNMGGNFVSGVADPLLAQDAATRAWVLGLNTVEDDLVAPATVTGVVATAGQGSMFVEWTASTEADMAGGLGTYLVEVDNDSLFATPFIQTEVGSAFFSITGLTPGVTFYVRVKAKDWFGDTSASWSTSGSATPTYVSNTDIDVGTISANKLIANDITAAQIAAGTITTTEIAAGTITASDIQAGTITSAEIAAGTIQASDIQANTITASEIAAGTITSNEIAANTITAGDIAANTITSGEIAADAITANELASITMEVSQYIESTDYDGTDFITGDATVGWRADEDGIEAFNMRARGQFETAASGTRVTITDDTVSFYTGDATEDIPAEIYAEASLGAGLLYVQAPSMNPSGGRALMSLTGGDGTTYESTATLSDGQGSQFQVTQGVATIDGQLDGTAFDWASFTPTLTQSGAVTKTVTEARYIQLGKLVIANVQLAVTAAGTAGNNVAVGLPVTAASSNSLNVGTFQWYDTSGAIRYVGAAQLASTTTCIGVSDSRNGGMGVNPNLALANGDSVRYTIMYEAA